MTLAAGQKLGPYEIVSAIGAGGMGEVYRARDERLNRDVAIKILPAAVSEDADRVRRFEREAQAAGTLNHPNVTAVFDIGRHDGLLYVVSELLEGETLRGRLAAGALPARKAIEFALQIASGLAAAHEKGIVHRDLKPDNIFVTRDGRIKILDFGLASKRPLDAAGRELTAGTALPTVEAPLTEPGTVLGTLGYMSPEQLRGLSADERSDIFSFGAILYEMLAGRRAFRGVSAADTMSAILSQEPPDLSPANESVSPGLERIVRHCLEKNPEERFHSAHDLAFDLAALSGSFATRTKAIPQKTYRAGVLGRIAAAMALLGAVAAASFFAGRRAGVSPAPSFQPLTFRQGSVSAARFLPDGHGLVYSAQWEGSPSAVFASRLGSTEATAVPVPESALFGISPSGDLALQIAPRLLRGFTFTGMLARVPLAGGTPRDLLEHAQWADWMRDGSTFAVVRDAGGKNQLEFPAGKAVYQSAGFISHPRLAPSGTLVAFLEHPLRDDDGGFVAVVDASGKKREISGRFLSLFGLAWAPDGSEVWFTGERSGRGRSLWAATLTGRERLLAAAAGTFTLHDSAPGGRALVSHENSRVGIMALAPGESKERDLSWLDWSLVQDLSADGRTFLFSESGVGAGSAAGIYVRKTDGSPAVRLGDGTPQALSPDGKWVLALTPGAPPNQIVLLPTGAGQMRHVTSDAIHHQAARFFYDGRKIVFAGNEPGRGSRLFVQDLSGGQPRAITPEGAETGSLAPSPDGRWVAGTDAEGRAWLYSAARDERRAIRGVTPGDRPFGFSPDGKSLYTGRRGKVPHPVFRVDLESGRSELWRELVPADASGLRGVFDARFSSDGTSYVYSYARQLSTLYLVEGLK